MPRPQTETGFEQIRRAIVERQPMSPPPPFEILVGKDVRSAWLGRPIESLKDEVAFWSQAGYCLMPISFGVIQFGGMVATDGAHRHVGHAHYSLYRDGDVEMEWAETGTGVIASDADFERFAWPDPDKADLSVLDQAQALLPHGMRVMAGVGKIFTGTWQLMGFTGFAEALSQDPNLVERVFERVASIQACITERVASHPAVGAVIHADDLAYFTGPMVNPDVFRRYVFPTYRRLGEFCRKRGIIYLFHSDGDVRSVIGDLIECGFVGLHPIEPKPMNGVEVKQRWGDRLCLLGHVDVDLLARGTPQQVRDQTRSNLDALARDGGYCPGSANSVPDYVPLPNYLAMLEAIQTWK